MQKLSFDKAGQGRWVESIDVPTLNTNTFATATNRTNIHNKQAVRAVNHSSH
jgi:hypothetical protein